MVKYLSFHNSSFALMFYCKWQHHKGWAHAQLKEANGELWYNLPFCPPLSPLGMEVKFHSDI
jgi:hypothetical protein